MIIFHVRLFYFRKLQEPHYVTKFPLVLWAHCELPTSVIVSISDKLKVIKGIVDEESKLIKLTQLILRNY
jgi:hypothetical protein